MKLIFQVLSAISIILFLGSCNESLKEHVQAKEQVSQVELLSSLFHTDNLKGQIFEIKPNRDTTIHGKDGTVLRIYKNTFIDENGNLVKALINIELKEALKPMDIVYANLTTTSNGQFLQTDGMIYLDASCEGKPLKIAKNSAVGVMVPSKSVQSNMKIFKGEKTDNGINWIEPKPTLNKEVKLLEEIKDKPRAAAVKVTVNEIGAMFDFVDSIDGSSEIDERELRDDAEPRFVRFTNEIVEKGRNYFSVDVSATYIFEMKSLGWANIDRLYSDKRTELVELETIIDNSKDFEKIYITMVISQMYLPGYQMKSGNYSFTHGDDEKPKLPIGEKAIIFATGYKKSVPHFDLITTSIKKKETIKLHITETNLKDLKETLESKL